MHVADETGIEKYFIAYCFPINVMTANFSFTYLIRQYKIPNFVNALTIINS